MYATASKPSSQGYHALSMTKAVERLRAGGDLPNAQYQPQRPQRRCLVHSGFEIEYEVVPGVMGQGSIEILAIRLTADKAKGRERSGLWDVRYSNASLSGGWLAEKWEPDFSQVPDKSSVKVGINGYSGDLLSTAGSIATHIIRGSAAKEAELKKNRI